MGAMSRENVTGARDTGPGIRDTGFAKSDTEITEITEITDNLGGTALGFIRV